MDDVLRCQPMTSNSSRTASNKTSQKWNVLKHGVIWVQKLRTSVQKWTPADNDQVGNSKQTANWNKSSRGSLRIFTQNKKPHGTGLSTQKWSSSIRYQLRNQSNQDYCRLSHASSETTRPESILTSANDGANVLRNTNEFPQTLVAYHGPWKSKYDPLPSPELDMHNMDLFKLSVSAPSETFEDIIKDESLQRQESSQSLNNESGGDNGSTSLNAHGDDMLGGVNINRQIDLSVKDPEQAEAILRRGRRRAIIDEKNLIGDSENEGQDGHSGDHSMSKTAESSALESPAMVPRVNVFRERQQRMLRKQHTIADFNSRLQNAVSPQEFDSKRRHNVFMKLIERRSRSKESLLDLTEALQRLTPSLFQDHYLESYRNSHWTNLDKTEETQETSESNYPEREIRRREAVWELFKSELVFFLDHLMVLKNCFMEPLKKLQVDGYLMFVEPSNLFGNLDDLCYVSHTLCRELIGNLSRDATSKDFGSMDVLLRPLKRWSEHSKDGEVYHSYCLNYDAALTYLDNLRKVDQFNEFEKWCEQDPRCRRLQLTDLLVAPMQHYMKIPLLLASIRKYTLDANGREMLSSCLNKVEHSLKSLEDKMRWLKNFERLQEIQSQLIWPSVSELEPRVFIPEFLRQSLTRQPCERLIANPKRQLLHEGFLTFSDGSKIVEIFAFLFDDFLLITRIKKQPKKKSFSENPLNARSITEGGLFVVYKQAIALDRFTIHDLGSAEANANGLRHAIVLVLITRFQQITGVYTLQAANELDKQRWIERLRESQQMFQEKLKQKLYGIDADHKTNKHSKLLVTKPKCLTGQASIDGAVCPKELYVSIPSRASSASPSSLTRNKTSSPELYDEEDEERDQFCESTLPTVQIDRCQQVRSSAHQNSSFVRSTEKRIPQESSRVSCSPSGSTKSDNSVTMIDLDCQSRDRLITDNTVIVDTATAKQRFFECAPSDLSAEPKLSSNRPSTIASMPVTSEYVPETKVEFLYSATGQSPFSPPLSPTLYPPCASLPSAVTLPSFYDYPSSSFQNELEHRMNQLRLGATTSQTSSRNLPQGPPEKKVEMQDECKN